MALVARAGGCSTAAAHKRLQRGRHRLVALLDGAANARDPVADGCAPARARASALLDGRLGPADTASVFRHIDGCDRCPPVLRVLETVVRTLGDLGDDPSVTALRAEVRRHAPRPPAPLDKRSCRT